MGRSGVDGGGMCYCGDEGGGDGGELGVWMNGWVCFQFVNGENQLVG